MGTQSTADERKQAAEDAAGLLAPFRGDPGVNDVIGTLTSLAGEDDGKIEKALAKIGAARVGLVKDETITPMQAVEQRLDKAEQALQSAYLAKHSVGFSRAEANSKEAERIRQASLARG